jgi:hypothetical protein
MNFLYLLTFPIPQTTEVLVFIWGLIKTKSSRFTSFILVYRKTKFCKSKNRLRNTFL